jgi:hypothetical protein
MKWFMNINGDIWTQDESQPLKMIETKTSQQPETIDFWNSRSVTINLPFEKTISDIHKEMLESALENQQSSNTKTKGDRE